MKKPDPFYGFLLIYLGLIVVSFLAYQLIFTEAFVSSSSPLNLSYAIALSSLTQINGSSFSNQLPASYQLFSLIISQISGIIILSWLLWFYWKLFGNKNEKEAGLRKAFKLTILITLIAESFLFLFFLYGIPTELTDSGFQNKLIAALSLAINSFTNAGYSHSTMYFNLDVLGQNFILQIGIVGGSVLGSLGIFVIYELLSPKKLRERLSDHSIDWSFITKVSVYGTILILILFSCIFFFIESNNYLEEKNLMESIIASIYEISRARGFGLYLADNVEYKFTSVLKILVSIFGAGPFSTGGGLTLLSLIWFYSLLWKNPAYRTGRHDKSLPRRPPASETGQAGMHFKIANSLAKNLIIYSLITFCIPTLLLFVIDSESTVYSSLMSQLELYSTNLFMIKPSTDWMTGLIKGFTIIAGRIGFMVACFITLRKHKSGFSTDLMESI